MERRTVIDSIHGLRFLEESQRESDFTVIRLRPEVVGFIDLFEADCLGFKVYSDKEIEYELELKAKLCYPEIDVKKMFEPLVQR